jgi:hypothetical protein
MHTWRVPKDLKGKFTATVQYEPGIEIEIRPQTFVVE